MPAAQPGAEEQVHLQADRGQPFEEQYGEEAEEERPDDVEGERPPTAVRPAADRRNNLAFSRRRIVVEYAIGRLRRNWSRSHVTQHQRKGNAARVRAVAGRVNRMLAGPAA